VEPLAPRSVAPAIEGVDLDSPTLLVFYKITCPVCQLAAPVLQGLHEAYPGILHGIGQDPDSDLADFAQTYGLDLPTRSDAPPYPTSNAYGVRVVPTMFLVDGGEVRDVVESWDRDGYNRVSVGLAERAGVQPVTASTEDDGLPAFRPG
jgi:thiol-disulfide isomerase/thioredoxin